MLSIRGCLTFQPSARMAGGGSKHPEHFHRKTESVLSSPLVFICSFFLENHFCFIFHFLWAMLGVSWSLEVRERQRLLYLMWCLSALLLAAGWLLPCGSIAENYTAQYRSYCSLWDPRGLLSCRGLQGARLHPLVFSLPT